MARANARSRTVTPVGIMGHQRERDPPVPDVDVRMVVGLLGEATDRRHELERRSEAPAVHRLDQLAADQLPRRPVGRGQGSLERGRVERGRAGHSARHSDHCGRGEGHRHGLVPGHEVGRPLRRLGGIGQGQVGQTVEQLLRT